MSNEATYRVLLVEDNPGDARLIHFALEEVGDRRFNLSVVDRLAAALERLAYEPFDVVLLDLSLPDSQGPATCERVAAAYPELAVIILTGLDDEALAVATMQRGAQDYLPKAILDGRTLLRSMRYSIERKRIEAERDRLLASEREKSEQLQLSIREAHHRIKNNLQAISDLLYLELTAGTEGSALDALRESMERIQAIALVHDLLSQDRDVRTVETQNLVEKLVPMVLQSSCPQAAAVMLHLEVSNIPLSSKKSTSLALILNELVSNSAKHAFRSGPGMLRVSVRPEGSDLVVEVQDNGPGLLPDFDLRRDSDVGLEIVRTLAERDLEGSFGLASADGLLARIRFPV